ncbi:DNA repair protein rad16 [Coprinopsis sp. MPI-PUGE-AT-0042]|nr:DNA repair protein rad16 [Coprinopsis sp. MPI-PUGE-AT-0042]
MARATRSSARRADSNLGTPTTTTTATPAVSAQNSSKGADTDTPATSDQDEMVEVKPKKRAPVKRTVSGGKRKVQEESDDGESGAVAESDEEDVTEPPARRAPKRRAVGNKAYIEVPSTARVDQGEGEGKEVVETPSPARASPRTKGKAKTVVVEESTPSEEEEDEIVESDETGSEFAMSEDDEQDAVDSEADEEDDEIMLEAGLRESLQISSSNGRNGESSSSGARRGPGGAAELAAAAAERRIANKQKAVTLDAEEFMMGSDSDEEDGLALDSGSGSDSDAKGKGKAEPTWGATEATVKKSMTLADLRRAKKIERDAKAQLKRYLKKKERALAQVLGRPLSHSEKNSLALQEHHPELVGVWGDLDNPPPKPEPKKAEQPANLKAVLLPFQRESLHWMRKQETTEWKGGILADEMGMGKTIQIISLLVSSKAKPNLVIAPTVAIMQWRNEIATHTEGMKVLVWHGGSRETDMDELKKFDVVLTTYAVLESCFRKQHSGFKRKGVIIKEQSPLHGIQWKRIVLDEAHNIKERSTNTARAAFQLKGDFKWCLSGTPLQNRVGELYSIIRFLQGDPFAYYFCKVCDCKSLHWKFSDKRTCDDCGHTPMMHTCFWNNEVLSPIQKQGMEGAGTLGFKKLRVLLDQMMLRRTKLQRADDLGLPPRTIIVRRDYFSPEEKELYLSLFSDAKRQFSTYLDQGTVLNNYSNIFSLLTRMRQMACHPDLVIRSKANATAYVPDEGEGTVCRLCNEFAEDAIQSKCHHVFDRECIRQYLEAALEAQPDCPVCHVPLTIDLEAPALEIEDTKPNARQGILGRLNLDKWRSSSKIEALVEELSNLRLKDAATKSIVFSQFVNFLDLIAYRLQRAGFNVCRLEGTMSPQARDATIKHFMNNVEVTVFLVSLKAGGVALNLTEASRVYLMDSWWNPAVEFQAMDRIHRLGQRRPVEAIKLVVEDSIESRIVQLQEKKSAMIDATLSTDDSAMGRLTPDDLGFLFRL